MIDENINNARNFLFSVLEDKSTPKRAKELAGKMLALIGFARSNVEDLLLLVSIIDKTGLDIDIRSDIESLVSAQLSPAAGGGQAKSAGSALKSV